MTSWRGRLAQTWMARLAFVAMAAAALLLLVSAGLRSFVLLGAGLTGLAVAAAAVWWALSNRGMVRALAVVLAVMAPTGVVVYYATVGLLWAMLLSLALCAVGVSIGRAALSMEVQPVKPPEYSTPPPERPFLIMNPLSGGGRVESLRLSAKAEKLGADVVLLDPDHPQDVTELARAAVVGGADLLGVASGDGTQALVAGVAAEHDVPFMVIPAGTRNHFAMDLGLDRDDPSTCLDALTDGVELRIDLGLISERVFVNNASFGAYAAVVQSPAYRDNKTHTILEMLPDLLTHHRGPRLRVHAGNVTIDTPQAVLVSNNPYQTDDPAGLAHRERMDSGVLGVLGIRVDSAASAAGLLRGQRSAGLTALTAQEVVVTADAAEIPVGLDGEALTVAVPVTCRTWAGALRVRVPRHRPGVPRAKPPMNWRRLRGLVSLRTWSAGADRPSGPRACSRPDG